MDFIRKIREDNCLSCCEVARRMGIQNVQNYIVFERSKFKLNAKKLVKFWRLSGLSGDTFMKLMEKEVIRKGKSNRRK
ncbi:MAG: hypothetical protein AAGA80_06570 [Cyanobacteria bacterium P01_F01_bin.143]